MQIEPCDCVIPYHFQVRTIFNLICIIRLYNNDLFIFNLGFSRFSNSSQEMHDLRNMMENLSQRFESLSDYRFGNNVARKLLS